MQVFLRAVTEAVVETGLSRLMDCLAPGGGYLVDVGARVFGKLKDRQPAKRSRLELEQIVQVDSDLYLKTLDQVTAEVLAGFKEGGGIATPVEVEGLKQFLMQIPDVARESMKRPDDPAGRSIPSSFALNTPGDVQQLLPSRVSRYRIGDSLPGKAGWVLVRLLGIGGFGEVWYARHRDLASLDGAVKFCLGETAVDLRHEASLIDRVMRMGRHPNLVPLIDVNLQGDPPWLLFEYVSGGSLKDLVYRLAGKESQERVGKVNAALLQLVEAVAFFHQQMPQIVHRDLKPSNILLDSQSGNLRITDFGIGSLSVRDAIQQSGKALDQPAGRLMTGRLGSHTRLYASPQQIAGAAPDPRDDVHALGVIAYQMFTGRLLDGPGADFAEDLKEVGVPEETISLLGRCMAQRVDRRPKDAVELKRSLENRSSDQKSKSIQLPAEKPVAASAPQRSSAVEGDPLTEEMREFEAVSNRGNGAAGWLRTKHSRVRDWSEAARIGRREAKFFLGLCHQLGIGKPQDRKRASDYFRAAAAEGEVWAMCSLGELYEQGIEKGADYAEAKHWYERATACGNASAMARLGLLWMSGHLGSRGNEMEASKWLRRAAENGNGLAMRSMGLCYETGKHRNFLSKLFGAGRKGRFYHSPAQAMSWYSKAAEAGNGLAMVDLGRLFDSGKAFKRDRTRALEWYRKAADFDNPEAMIRLGDAYSDGNVFPVDYAKAMEWYQKAAKLGDGEALRNIGRLHEKGLGVEQNYQRAMSWYQKSAVTGWGEAMVDIGRMHYQGLGVRKDQAAAQLWFEKAKACGYFDDVLLLLDEELLLSDDELSLSDD